MKQKTILLELLRWLCAGLAVVFLVVSFRQEPVSSAAFEDVASAVTASIDLSALQEGSVQMVKRLYGLLIGGIGDRIETDHGRFLQTDAGKGG